MDKKCIKCKENKDINEFSQRKYPNGHISHRGECKECIKKRQKTYQEIHQKEIKIWHSEYYQKHKQKINEKNDIWWDNNRNKMNEHRKNKRKKEVLIPISPNSEDIYKNWV